MDNPHHRFSTQSWLQDLCTAERIRDLFEWLQSGAFVTVLHILPTSQYNKINLYFTILDCLLFVKFAFALWQV